MFQERWGETLKEFGVDNSELTSKWWGIIQEKYSEPTRFYHTLTHLENIFHFYPQCQSLLQQPTFVKLALFFHDIIYDPKAKDNEEKSADLFREFAIETGKIDTNNIDLIYSWIIATKSHTTTDFPTGDNSDINLLLDMDLSVFGSSRELYAKYSDDIQKEYSFIALDFFYQKRGEVMSNFSPKYNDKIQFVFRSPFFRSKFEEIAISNLDWEIQHLKTLHQNLLIIKQ